MPDAYTHGDALGLYLTGTEAAVSTYGANASLGGVRLALEVPDLRWKIANPIPNVVVLQAGGDNGTGTGYIRGATADSLTYTAPGDTEGAAVSIAAGETKVLTSGGDADKWVRVYREDDRDFPVNGLSLGMQLKLRKCHGGVVGMDNLTSAERAAGLNTYRGVMLFNHSPLEVTNIKAWVGAGGNLQIGWEAPGADGSIQVIADDATAPAAVVFVSGTDSGTGLSLASLDSQAGYGLWLCRAYAAGGSAAHAAENTLYLQFDYDGVTYTRTIPGQYAVADDSLDRYELYAGLGVAIDYTTPVATSATLPFNYMPVLPGPGTTRVDKYVCRKRNKYNLVGGNVYATEITIDENGDDVSSPLSVPENVTLTALPGGEVEVLADYYGTRDADPADTWLIYATTTGVDPDPTTDTPTEVDMSGAGTFGFFAVNGAWGSLNKGLRAVLGPYSWGTDLRVLVRVRRKGTPDVDSNNTAATALTVSTVAPRIVAHRATFLGDARAQEQTAPEFDTETVISGTVKWRQLPGETLMLDGSTLLWRAVVPDSTGRGELHIPSTWTFNDATTFVGPGTGTIEVVAGPPKCVYINVAGTRRVKIDITNSTISAAEWVARATLTDCPDAGPVAATATETLLQVWDPAAGRWRAYLCVNSSGQLKIADWIRQTRG